MSDWGDDKQKQLMDFLQPDGMQQGMSTAQAMGIGAPAAGGGSPPLPPTISPKEQSITSDIDDDDVPDENNNPEKDKSNIVDSDPQAQLPNYIKGQEQQVDKYSPDKQQAVLDMIQKQQTGLGTRLGRAGSTLADGIMQGVARAGSSNFRQTYDENLLNRNKMQAAALPQLQEMNAKNLGAKQGLERLSASTPLGASDSEPAKFLAKQLFPKITPEQLDAIGKNPQALASIIPPGVDLKKALAEIENTAAYRNAELGLQKDTLANTEHHQEDELKLAKEQKEFEANKERADAAEKLADRGVVRKGLDLIPGTSGHAEKKILEGIRDSGAPSSHGIPELGQTFNGHKVISVKRIK